MQSPEGVFKISELSKIKRQIRPKENDDKTKSKKFITRFMLVALIGR